MITAVDPRTDGVAIVGMGALFPAAADLDSYWHNVSHAVDAIGDVPPDRLDPVFFEPGSTSLDRFYCRRGGFVDGLASFDPTAFGMMPVSVPAAEPDQLIALTTAAAAVDDAGGAERFPTREKVAVVIGRGGYLSAGLGRLDQRVRMAEQLVRSLRQLLPGVAEEDLAAVRAEFQHQLGPYRADDAIGLVPNLVASRIANRFDFAGPAYTVDAACASSLIAIDHGLRLLRSGECDAVIAGGVHHCHDLTLWGVFSQLGAVSATGHSRPFSRAADGLLIGEGTGMVVLKRQADAERDDDRVYAVIRGIGVSSDGRESTVLRPSVAGQVLALRRAWDAAALDPSTIGLMEAHGTATPAGDAAELASLAQVFGPATSEGGFGGQGRVPIGSVKSMIGHAMPAAGVAGLIKAALALHHRVLPPTLHCEEPHPALAGTRFRPLSVAQPWEATDTPRRAGVNAFGFGGINAHAVLEEHRPGPVPGARRAPFLTSGARRAARILFCAADDARSLLAQLDEPSGRPDRPARLRLAIVNPTRDRVALARKAVERGDAWRGRMDVWFSPAPLLAEGGRLAFLFPGLEAAVSGPVDDVAARFRLPAIPPADTSQLGRHGIAVFTLGGLLDGALAAMGVRPDLIAGHSIGEWNGMVAAGMVRADTAGPYLARLDPAAIGMAELVYAAAGCSTAVAAEAVDGIHEVVVSHDNCPHQSILCGTEPAIAEALDRLRARRVIVSELPFRSGFHSPMFVPRLRQVREALELLPVAPPATPLWSATTCEPYPDGPDKIRELAARHLIEPIRFRELTLQLHKEGVRAFVQVGVGSLVGFVDDTLRDQDHLAVAAGTASGPGVDQLCRVAAALWVEGGEVSFDRLLDASSGAAGRAGTTAARSQSDRRRRAPGIAASIHQRPVVLGTPLVDLTALPPLRIPASVGMTGGSGSGSAPVVDRAPSLIASPPAIAGAAAAIDDQAIRPVSVEHFGWLVDHCLARQRDGWPSVADRFPVVPLTTMIGWLIERGGASQPDRVVTRLERIRALRWLAAAPAVDVVLSAVAEGPDQVRVGIDGYSQAIAVLSDRAKPAPAVVFAPLPAEEPSDVDAAGLYQHRWMFHGPRFHAVSEIIGICDAGIRGRLRVLDAPGSLLDGAGQLVGYWVMARTATDRIVLPTGVDHIDLFGPEPAVGTEVDCTVRITEVGDTAIRADLDLSAGGRLWARVVGWTEHRFETDAVLWDVLRFPEFHLASEPHPGGWVLTSERWRRSASRDLVMRQYLTGPEREQYRALNPLAQRAWLLGRMAAKDAARDWLWSHGAGPLFPAEVEVTNLASGQPQIRGSFTADLHISLAHSRTLGVAIVADGRAVGIDIEAVATRDQGFDLMVLTDGERRLVPAADRDRWITRFWVAKEAMAKALGSGLNGRPKDFEITDIDANSARIGDRWIDTEIVRGEKGDEFIVGWTRAPDA